MIFVDRISHSAKLLTKEGGGLMRDGSHWFHEYHWDTLLVRRHLVDAGKLLKGMWLGALLLVLGVVALITAIILAYPVMAHIAANFFQ